MDRLSLPFITEVCRLEDIDLVHGYGEAFAHCQKLFGVDAHAVSSSTWKVQE